MSYSVRKAEIKDAPGIAKVHVETWQTHYKGQVPDDYLANLSIDKRTKVWVGSFSNPKPKTSTFVAEENNEILGFCSVGPSRDSDAAKTTGELYAIYLLPAKHDQGIGAALMKAGLSFLKTEGFTTASLWVLKSNAQTIKFYEQKGWQADGQEKRERKNNFTLQEIRYQIAL